MALDVIVPMSKLGEATRADVEKKMRRVLISVFAHLDSASPIGRPELWQRPPNKDYRPGWFKANWRIIFGVNHDQPVQQDVRSNKSALALRGFKLGAPMLIVNNAPYAQRLAEGHSSQAPIGWVEAALKSGVRSATR